MPVPRETGDELELALQLVGRAIPLDGRAQVSALGMEALQPRDLVRAAKVRGRGCCQGMEMLGVAGRRGVAITGLQELIGGEGGSTPAAGTG